jgi:hypothetical protein
MAQEQNTHAPTNSDSQPVSFTDVSFAHLKTQFKDTFKVSKGSASQVVLGFQSMTERLTSPQNEYQQTLYPKLKQLCTDLYTRYETSFLSNFESDVERQVFGANLNGNRNNGSLYRSIPSGVNRTLTYNYAQFGQLMRVLVSRLKFVVQRDPNSVQRYKENQTEFVAYQKLQTTVNTFLDFLTTVSNDWNSFVNETRTKFSVETEQRPQRQQRTVRSEGMERPQRGERTQRPRVEHQQRPQRPRGDSAHHSTTPTNSTSRPNYKSVRTTSTTQANSQDNEWQSVSTRSQTRRPRGRSHPVVV